ncbi:glycoside hydrolase family 43 protein [Microbacterium jejuense]|uniref:Glycoside hydrolase family 43 protein n=1 Tax=Microbacterium jejuense TaxID=1263637 RepID=A0ABS7HQ22_9MICO|nr:glycoside hydrolase family 43 protein [Microbacterium jejuense]MBW9094968.1 glycoside hydrolase family 43 protein [Microbacterium jejuense]
MSASEHTGYEAYLFAHFVGEDGPDAEQVHLAVSRGDTLSEWDMLAGGAPVLRSSVGTGGIRDPFLLRLRDGEGFVMLATDLQVYGIGHFRDAQEHGSTALLVWESRDLVTWDGPRRVEVMPPERAGNAWAPEAIWCEEAQTYAVYWASNLYDEGVERRNADSYNRMMIATTDDFVTFTEPRIWIDVRRAPGYGTIDSTVIRHGDVYHRFTKDEHPDVMHVFHEVSPDLFRATTGAAGSAWDLIAERIGSEHVTHGEGPIVVPSLTDDRWFLLLDWPPYGGGTGYVLFETDDIDSGRWTRTPQSLPPRFRHGSVIPVTAAERQRLLTQLPPATHSDGDRDGGI